MKKSNTISGIKEVLQHSHIVFGFEHYNPLGIVRSLGEYGISPIAIVVRNKRPITSKSKYIKTLHLVDSIEEGYELLIKNYGKSALRPFVYASDDQVTNYMDNHYDDIKDTFYFYNAGKQGRIGEYQDKGNILQCAMHNGLNVLETKVVSKGEIPKGLEFPVITKAIVSTIDNWKDDAFICHNEKELINAYKQIKSEKVLIQKYLNKKNELCLDGYCVNKGMGTAITISSTYNYILSEGYSHYMTITDFDNQKLKDKLEKMFYEIGFEGIFSVEFLVSQTNELFFLEINFRNSTWSYASTCKDMPIPIMWAIDMKRRMVSVENLKIIGKPFMAMVEFDDFRNRVKTKQISFFKWIRDFKRCGCTYYFNRHDIKPFLSVITAKIRSGRK